MRKKANVRPELVGELFLKPGEDIPYRLVRCDTEPLALMQKVNDVGTDFEMKAQPLSKLADFVLLKPVRPIEAPKKPRADKGQPHKKAKTDDLTEQVLRGTPLAG